MKDIHYALACQDARDDFHHHNIKRTQAEVEEMSQKRRTVAKKQEVKPKNLTTD